MSGVVFNANAFFQHLGGDRDLGREILMVYLEDAPARTKSLFEAVEDKDKALVIKFSHALKGISATIRAERLTMLAGKVEKSARKDDLDSISILLPLIQSELESVIQSIEALLN